MMKIKAWMISLNADLADGGTYHRIFQSRYVDKTMTLDELIEALKKFKDSVMLIEEVEE